MNEVEWLYKQVDILNLYYEETLKKKYLKICIDYDPDTGKKSLTVGRGTFGMYDIFKTDNIDVLRGWLEGYSTRE